MKRWLMLCLVFSLLFSCASAEMEREEILTFGADCPQEIHTLLDEHGYADAVVQCGAAMIYEQYDGRGRPMYWSMAVLIADHGGVRQFFGLQWVVGTQNVVIETHDLAPLDLDMVTVVQPVIEGHAQLDHHFALQLSDGSSYEFSAAYGSTWILYRYTDPQGESISLRHGVFRFGEERHYTITSGWLNDPDTIRDFPKTPEEARAAAQRSWEGIVHPDHALVWGVNLRTEPTSNSRSLGKYNTVLATVLGQKPGRTHPWYHVRIGDTQGWVSGRYVTFPDNIADFAAHASDGICCATALVRAKLYASMDDGAAVQQLEAGTPMQLLAQTEDGWLHVLVTDGGLDLRLNASGTYGYVRAENVLLTTPR